MDKTAQFESLRPHLFALAYRIMGTRADAEDMLQDAFLRWQATQEEVDSPKAYLMTVVSRLCLDGLRQARRRREQYVGVWLPEPIAGARPADESLAMTESVSMAFLFLLESLQPNERVAFLLREVFDYEYEETAKILETSEENCRQLVSRARKSLREGRPKFQVRPEQHRAVIEQFAAAVTCGDMTALLELLRGDAVSYSDGGGKVYAALNPIRGADHVARFFLGLAAKSGVSQFTYAIQDSAGAPALWLFDKGRLETLLHLSLDEAGKIESIYIVRNPDKLPKA